MSCDAPLPITEAHSELIPSDIQPAMMLDDTYDEQMHAIRFYQPFTLPESLPDQLVEYPNRTTELPGHINVAAQSALYPSSVLLEPPSNTQPDSRYAEAERRLCEILNGIRDPTNSEPTTNQGNTNAETQPEHPMPPPAFLQPSIDPHPNSRAAEAERRFRELLSRGCNSGLATYEYTNGLPDQDFQVRKPTGNLLAEIRKKHFPTAPGGSRRHVRLESFFDRCKREAQESLTGRNDGSQ